MAADLVARSADRRQAGCVDIDRDAARDHPVHHQAVAEGGGCATQDPLAQHRAVGVHQREGRVVADRADVTEMIGDALELRHQRAQPVCARRCFDAAGGLDRPREGE